MTSTRFPAAAKAVARLTAVVVLPTPPFWLTIARMRGMAAAAGGVVSSIASSGAAVMLCTDHLFQAQHGAGGVRDTLVQRGPHIPRFARLGQFFPDGLALQKE